MSQQIANLGGGMFTDPRENPFAMGLPTLGMQALGGSLFTDPSGNPAYQQAMGNLASQYARDHQSAAPGPSTGASIGPGPGNQYQAAGIRLVPGGYVTPGPGNQFHAGAPPQQTQQLPTVQPPQINWGLINQLLGNGSAGATPMPTYNSNITAGPVYTPQQTSAAQGAIAGGGGGNIPLPPGMGASGEQGQEINNQAANLGHGQTAGAAVQFGRDAAAANAQQQLQSQAARAQQGVQLANFLGTIQGQNFSNQDKQRSLMAALLGQLSPLMGMG